MAVLVEAISVIVRRSAIDEKFPGGWTAFVETAPNSTLCADSRVARVGFMHPSDVQAYVGELERAGLVYLSGGQALDIAVVDQQRGPAAPCEWLQFGHIQLSRDQRVAVCRAVGDTENVMASPESWKYEGSLSQNFGSVPSGEAENGMRFLRHENGLDVYVDEATGKEMYVGRTGER